MYKGITPSVPKDFVRDLKKIDSSLDCEFSREHSKFMITQVGKISGRVPVLIVGDNGEGYRYPDQRDIRVMQMADMHRKGQEVKDRIRIGEEYMLNEQKKQQERVKDDIRHATKMDKIQLANAYNKTFNTGKSNSAYRRR